MKIISSWLKKEIPGNDDLTLVIDTKVIPEGKCIFYACEPYVINRHDGILEWICQEWQHFNLVLTHDNRILEACPNAKLFCWTSLLIPETEYNLFQYPNKKFQLSFICGGKMMCQGHLERIRVWEMQSAFNIPKRFYYSTQVRGNLPVYPGNLPLDTYSKREPFIDSMFHIAFENCRIENYFSEKLIDCFVGKTVPIYYGCPNINKFFDTRGIIIVNSVDEIFDVVNRLTVQDFYDRIDYIEKNRKIAIDLYSMNQIHSLGKMLEPYLVFPKIYYGADGNYTDITDKCRGLKFIPEGDNNRFDIFQTDPAYGKVKEIVIKYPKYTLVYPYYMKIPL